MSHEKTLKEHLNEILGAPREKVSVVRVPRATDHGSRADDRQVGGSHYKNMDVSPWDVVDTWPLEQRIGAYRAGALKYLMRMGSKDEEAQEIAKGIHYMEKLLDTLKQESTQSENHHG
jgi:hypothetical protein